LPLAWVDQLPLLGVTPPECDPVVINEVDDVCIHVNNGCQLGAAAVVGSSATDQTLTTQPGVAVLPWVMWAAVSPPGPDTPCSTWRHHSKPHKWSR